MYFLLISAWCYPCHSVRWSFVPSGQAGLVCEPGVEVQLCVPGVVYIKDAVSSNY